MTRLQQAEQQLHNALWALESAVESAVESALTPDPVEPGAGDRTALATEIAMIEARLGKAIALIAAADKVGYRGGA